MKFQDSVMAGTEFSLSGPWVQARTRASHKVARGKARASATVRKLVSGLWGELERFVPSGGSRQRVRNGSNAECSEEMFRYLLASECKRSERSNCVFQLFLVSLSTSGGLPVQMDGHVAGNLFTALRRCLRATDYIGWCQDGLVVGAVLTALGDSQLIEVSRQVEERFIEASWECLSVDDFNKLQLRICQHHEVEAGRIGLGDVRLTS